MLKGERRMAVAASAQMRGIRGPLVRRFLRLKVGSGNLKKGRVKVQISRML